MLTKRCDHNTFFLSFLPSQMNRSPQSAVIQIFHWLWQWRLDCPMWSFPLIKTAKRWSLEKQRSNTKLQGRVTGRDRVSFLGFGPVMHMPPEHCHSCTLHSETVTKSNSNSCVGLDAVSSSTYVHFVHMGDERFQFTHVLESSRVTLQWLIHTQLKWQLECFLHLVDWVLGVLFSVYSLLWMDALFLLTDPSFFKSSIQKSAFPFTGHFTIWLLDLLLPCCFCMKSPWLQKDGAPAPCINVKLAFIKWERCVLKAFICKGALNS